MLQPPPVPTKPTRRSANPPPEPETTPSGVVPGCALFDTPPPGDDIVELDRSQRSRKPSARKVEALESQAGSKPARRRTSALKRKASRARRSSLSTDDEAEDHDVGEAGDTVSSQPVANAGPAVGNNRMAGNSQTGTGAITFFRKDNVVYDLSCVLGQDVLHLSTQQLEKLINAIPNPETQASALGNEEQHPTTIVQLATSLGVGGGYYRDRLDAQGTGSANSSQTAQQTSLKRRAHFEIDIDESATESEPDEPNLLALLAKPRPNPLPAPAASNSPASTAPDTATESESETQSESETKTASESESDSESEPSDPKSHIQPSHRAHAQPAPSTLSQSKLSGPSASAARVPSPRSQTSNPSTLPHNDAPQPVSTSGRAQPSASSAATSSARLATPVVQAGPLQECSMTQPVFLDRDISHILDSIIKLTQARAQQQPDASAGNLAPQAPSTSASSSAAPAATAPRPIIGLRSRPGRAQAAAMSAARSRAPSPADDPAEVLEQAAAALLGKFRARRKRPALSDFPGIHRQIASAAIPQMQTQAVTTDPFASPGTYEDWARDAYENAWDAHVPDNVPFEPAPPDLCKVIARRASHFRCKLKERLRPVVFWGYGFRSPVNSNADAKHNRRLVKLLTSDTFHCRDLETDTDQYEHPVFIRCIAEGLFWDLSGIGVLYHHKFNPIPLPAVALILTMMQFCIQEWRSGFHESRDLNLNQLMNTFDAHLHGLEIYGDHAALRLDHFQRRWFKFGMRYAGAVLLKRRRTTQPTTRAENVRPDTPPADEEGSTQSRRSKGKGCAAN